MVSRLRHRLIIEHLAARNNNPSSSDSSSGSNSNNTSSSSTSSSSSSSSNSTTTSTTTTLLLPHKFTPTSAPAYHDHRQSDPNAYLSPDWHSTALVGDSIPGFRTSAAFLSSLRTNLRLHASPPLSPIGTPPSMVASTSSLPPPSPLSASLELPPPATNDDSTAALPAAAQDDRLANVPDLQTLVTTDPAEQTAALKLVADSVAQMRQIAARALIFHPLNVAVWLACLSVLAKYMYRTSSDAGLVFTTAAGITMGFLVAVRWASGGYLELAEQVHADLLEGADVVVTKFGDEVIGTVILGWVPAESKGKRRKGYRAEIRGWAVRLRYRGKGEGLALLEAAVDEAKRKGAESVEFAEDHPNSSRILWTMYNTGMDRRERKAANLLQTLWETSGKIKKR